jgi:hypothetical protein
MVHLRNEFYLSDSEGLLITAISPEWKQIEFLCCLFYIRREYYFNKSSSFFLWFITIRHFKTLKSGALMSLPPDVLARPPCCRKYKVWDFLQWCNTHTKFRENRQPSSEVEVGRPRLHKPNWFLLRQDERPTKIRCWLRGVLLDTDAAYIIGLVLAFGAIYLSCNCPIIVRIYYANKWIQLQAWNKRTFINISISISVWINTCMLRTVTKLCVLNNDNCDTIFLVQSCLPSYPQMTVKVTNPLKTKCNLYYLQECSSILTDSTICIHYKDTAVHVWCTSSCCLLWFSHYIRVYYVGKIQCFQALYLTAHVVTTWLETVNVFYILQTPWTYRGSKVFSVGL